MPILLEFKSTKTIKMPNKIVDDLIAAILRIPSIAHQGANTTVTSDSDGCLTTIDLRVNGLSVIDEESHNMLCSVIHERIQECDLPFYLSGSSRHTLKPPGEALFLHERLKPIKSRNSKLLAKLKELAIPDEFCCPLSGKIMDEPVYDIRSPGVHYDQVFLEYCLRKSHKKLMPHTNTPCNESVIKTNFDLKIRIINFVQSVLQAAEIQNRKKILEKFQIDETGDKEALNKTLRRAAMAGDDDDIEILLSLGADVNAQDENPQKRDTALHWAIRENKIDNALGLVTSGARIDIPDASGITATQLMVERLISQDPKIQPLILNCNLLGLSLSGVSRTRTQPPVEMPMPNLQNNAALFGGGSSRNAQQLSNQALNFSGSAAAASM